MIHDNEKPRRKEKPQQETRGQSRKTSRTQLLHHFLLQLAYGIRQRNPISVADHLDIALPPVPIGAADDHFPALRVQAQLQQADGRLRFGAEIHGDDVARVLRVKLPLDLLLELGVVNRLLPRVVPLLATRVQHGDRGGR